MKLRILYFFLISVFTSCGIGLRNLDGFSVYKYPINNDSKKLVKYSGAYIQKRNINKGSTYLEAIVFNKKGICFNTGVDKDFWKNKDFWKHYNKHHVDLESKEYNYYPQCQYRISNDTIITQYFVSSNNTFYSKYIIEKKYKILNDNELKHFEWATYGGNLFGEKEKKDINYVNDTLIFFKEPTINFKSKQAWYERKKWYKKGLHSSRQ